MKIFIFLILAPILCFSQNSNRLTEIELHTKNCEECGMNFAGTISILV